MNLKQCKISKERLSGPLILISCHIDNFSFFYIKILLKIVDT